MAEAQYPRHIMGFLRLKFHKSSLLLQSDPGRGRLKPPWRNQQPA